MLSRIREARRAILTSTGLSPSQKIEQFRIALFQQLSAAPEAVAGRVSPAVETVDKAIQSAGPSGAYSLASAFLTNGEISRRAAHTAYTHIDYAAMKIPLSKEAASSNLPSCIMRMYCTFIKDAVEGDQQNRSNPSTTLTSSAPESAQGKCIQQ
ncbi:hypothetical protein [Neorickettsia sennetsu]|uniref:hypothetical protein n=1 Tax=Ehrlichia sennetsu TaxID=951 RepID=UPI0003186A4E|nr:hypothetical protein [Neorickettsia sennetsu]